MPKTMKKPTVIAVPSTDGKAIFELMKKKGTLGRSDPNHPNYQKG